MRMRTTTPTDLVLTILALAGLLIVLYLLEAHAQDARFTVQPRLPFVAATPPSPEPTPGVPPAPAYPLFTRQNVAPDTPDIVFEAFQDPTREKVAAARTWLLQRQQVTDRFQALMRELDREEKARQRQEVP
jgi:hypothetical protein